MSTDKHHAPFEMGPEEDLLATWAADGHRRWVEPVVARGRYWRRRLWLSVALISAFVGLPHLSIGGKPAVLIDLAARQFTFFGLTLHPTDNLLLLVFGAIAFLSLFFVTSVYGRLWCGYLCPHLVYLEFVFRPLETLFEGPPAVRRKRDAGPATLARRLRKTAKYATYLLIAGIMAVSFVAYFVPVADLWHILATAPGANGGVVAVVAALTGLSFLDFAIVREQMCAFACPYGRLQNVLYDQDTVIVGYDAKRGEPRGKLRGEGAGEPHGDCIDCLRCVHTCPTGIDIRRGLQLECVGCAQCVDACDEVMGRLGKPPRLVGYTSLRQLGGGARRALRGRTIVYLVLIAIVSGVFVTLLATRRTASVEVMRGAQEPYRLLPTGEVANMLRFRVTNHLAEPQFIRVTLLEPAAGALVLSADPLEAPPDAVETLNVVVKLPKGSFRNGRASARFKVESTQGLSMEKEFLLIGPYGG